MSKKVDEPHSRGAATQPRPSSRMSAAPARSSLSARRGPPLTPLLHGGPGTDEKRMRWTQRGGEANPRQSHRWACAAYMARKRISFSARLMSWTRIRLPITQIAWLKSPLITSFIFHDPARSENLSIFRKVGRG
ncbi:hypothetical protein SETIT_3G362200v2 [Setaria italica]|uniref:Uncharacterized protein n=1 Tax=Setaria italica TaxID=4555 RepID=A0A368QMQ3_SETIT|nr:hypothetical protein SETIT_3G362200v2 [Setaria italica]